MSKTTRKHRVVVHFTTDRPTTTGLARKLFADAIHGEHYSGLFWFMDRPPQSFVIRAVKAGPKAGDRNG